VLQLFRRLRYLLNQDRFDRELQDDMEFHREMAMQHGRSNFGNVLRLREDARSAFGLNEAIATVDSQEVALLMQSRFLNGGIGRTLRKCRHRRHD